MTIPNASKLGFTLAGVFALIAIPVHAALDNFGSGGNTFGIDFVTIGNAGNANDAGAGGGSYFSPYGGVSYTYRMGVIEVPQDWITKATNLGMSNVSAGAWTSLGMPAGGMTWYEAAGFVNWLNTSTGHQAAYQLDAAVGTLTLWNNTEAWQLGGENLYRHKDAHYFLPSESEWYKAAYHQNNGVTANYYDYATGSDAIPLVFPFSSGAGTALYTRPSNSAPGAVEGVNAIPTGLSPYGTLNQNGNMFEWTESASDGLNDSQSENRTTRGGSWFDSEGSLRSSTRGSGVPSNSDSATGFRIASIDPLTIPEPATASLLGFGAVILAIRRRRACSI